MLAWCKISWFSQVDGCCKMKHYCANPQRVASTTSCLSTLEHDISVLNFKHAVMKPESSLHHGETTKNVHCILHIGQLDKPCDDDMKRLLSLKPSQSKKVVLLDSGHF